MIRLEKWVLNEMIEHLQDMEGYTVYGCDLAYELFASEHVTGSYTCSAYEAKEWIKEHWDDLGDAVEEYESVFGTYPENPFRDPESFQVQIILHISSSLVGNSAYITNHWHDKIELTEDTINTIVSEW